MSEQWLIARDTGRLVRVDSLPMGAYFVAYDGEEYRLLRQHELFGGAWVVRSSDGEETTFAGCAEVLPRDQ